MLVLSRQRDQAIMIGDDVEVTIIDIRGDKTRIGITAPRSVSVHRKEIYDIIRNENRSAAEVKPEDVASLMGPPPMMKLAAAETSVGDPFLHAAIEQAQKSLSHGGLPIGAVLVRGNKIIGTGQDRRVQRRDPMAMAELDCLTNAASQPTYADTILYTTLTPTLSAAGAIIQSGIPKLFIADTANYAGTTCRAVDSRRLLTDCGIEVSDLQDPESIDMMATFIREKPEVWKAVSGL